MMNKMEQLGVLVPRVLPQVLPCPRSMVIDALQYIAGDFCGKTGVWSMTLQEDAIKGDSGIRLNPPKGVAISRVESVYIDGSHIDKDEYRSTANDILLCFVPQRDAIATIMCTVRPSRNAESLPEEIAEEWGDTIAYGALAKVKAMSGNNIEWTDAQGAKLALELYNEGCARARARMIRRKHGDSLFVGDL